MSYVLKTTVFGQEAAMENAPPEFQSDPIFLENIGFVTSEVRWGHVVVSVDVPEALRVAKQTLQEAKYVLNSCKFRVGADLPPREASNRAYMDMVTDIPDCMKVEDPVEREMCFNDVASPKGEDAAPGVKCKIDELHGPTLLRAIERLEAVIISVEAEAAAFPNRQKRSWNFSVDLTSAVGAVFSGLNNLLHGGNIPEIQKNQANMMRSLNASASFSKLLHAAQVSLQERVANIEINQARHRNATILIMDHIEDLSLEMAVAESLLANIEVLDKITSSGNDMADGQLPSGLIPPGEAKKAFEAMQELATDLGLVLLVSGPMDMYTVPTSGFVEEGGAWSFICHTPMTPKDKLYPFYRYHAVPWAWNASHSLTLEVQDKTYYATSFDLPGEVTHFQVPITECERFRSGWVCENTPVKKGLAPNDPESCIPAILNKKSEICQVKPWTGPWGPRIIGSKLVYFSEESQQLLTYPSERTVGKPTAARVPISKGRNVLDFKPGFTYETQTWTLYASWVVTSPRIVNSSLSTVSFAGWPRPQVLARPRGIMDAIRKQSETNERLRAKQDNLTQELEAAKEDFEEQLKKPREPAPPRFDWTEGVSMGVVWLGVLVVVCLVIGMWVNARRNPPAQ